VASAVHRANGVAFHVCRRKASRNRIVKLINMREYNITSVSSNCLMHREEFRKGNKQF